MSRLLTLAVALTAVVLTLISFIFTVLTTTHPDWSHQDTFDDSNTLDRSQYVVPIYTLYRSPFWTCSANPTNVTSTDNSTSAAQNNITVAVYDVTCVRYRPYGPDATSCQGLPGSDPSFNDSNPRYGDTRMCQAVHMAGNLAIASSVFVGVGMLAVFGLAALTLPALIFTDHHGARKHHHGHHPRPYAAPRVTLSTVISAATIFFLLASAAMLVLAQFYGIMGLIQDQRPNGDYATDGNIPSEVWPWVQGQASVAYASVGWFSGLLAAGGVYVVWGVPRLGVGEEYGSVKGGEGGEIVEEDKA